MYILQTPPAEELSQKLSADSLKTQTEQLIGTVQSSEPGEILHTLGQAALDFGLKLLAALAIYIIGAWLIKIVTGAVKKGFERKKSDRALASFVTSFVSIALWVILVIIAVSALGINTTSLAALLAAGGMAIGMALSGTVSNFAGGIMLLVFKPFKAGDYIEAQGYAGTVTEINIVSTKLLTVDNRIVVIPNGALSSGNINNISALDLRRVDQTVNVAYGSDADLVREAILSVVKSSPLSLDSTTEGASDPFVGVSALGDSTVSFVVRVWTKSTDYWALWFYLNENIYKELPRRGISFAFPQLDVHMKN